MKTLFFSCFSGGAKSAKIDHFYPPKLTSKSFRNSRVFLLFKNDQKWPYFGGVQPPCATRQNFREGQKSGSKSTVSRVNLLFFRVFFGGPEMSRFSPRYKTQILQAVACVFDFQKVPKMAHFGGCAQAPQLGPRRRPPGTPRNYKRLKSRVSRVNLLFSRKSEKSPIFVQFLTRDHRFYPPKSTPLVPGSSVCNFAKICAQHVPLRLTESVHSLKIYVYA